MYWLLGVAAVGGVLACNNSLVFCRLFFDLTRKNMVLHGFTSFFFVQFVHTNLDPFAHNVVRYKSLGLVSAD